MKRFITAMLALALTTALSSEKASAQDRMQPQTQLRDSGYFTGMVGKRHNGYEPAGQVYYAHGSNSLIPVAGSSDNVNSLFDCRPNIIDPDDCPEVMNPSGSNLHHCFVDFIVDPNDCPNVVDPYLHDDGAFLPWHRGSIYQ